MSRVLLRLRKSDKVRYLSHRDLIRAFELALRRARIPVAYSAGFNPRPRMSFGSAVGVGVTSDDERIVLELADPENPSDIRDRLNAQLPAGIEVLAAEAAPDDTRRGSSLAGLNASRYRIEVTCSGDCDPQAVVQAVAELAESSEIPVTREREGATKVVDIRPYLLEATAQSTDDCRVLIEVSLKIGDSGGAGAQDFVGALRGKVAALRVRTIHRLEQFPAERT